MFSKNEKTNRVVKGLLVLFSYFAFQVLQILPIVIFNIDFDKLNIIFQSTYLIFTQALYLAFLIFMYRNDLKKNWKDFKKNHKKYFKDYFKFFYILIILVMVTNLVIMLITNNNDGAENQQQIIDILKKSPVYAYIAAVMFAPVIEELIFRKSFRDILPDKFKILFIVFSGVVFGLMHVIPFSNPQELLYLISYSIPGIILGYVFVKSDNLFTNIGIHFVYNGILMSLNILLLIVGTL